MTGVGRTLPFRCRENPQTCRGFAARVALLARGGSTARAFESSRRRARARGVARGAVRRAPPRVRVAPFASLFVPVNSSERHVPAPSATTAMDAESNDALGRARADAPDSRTRLSSSASSSSASSSAPDATLLAPVSFALRPSRARPGPLAHRTHHHPHHHPHHPGVILPPVQSSRAVAARRRTDTDVVASASFVLGGVGISSSTAVAETGVDVGGPGRRRRADAASPSGNPTAFTSDAAADRRRAAEAAATRRARERRVATYAWGRCDAGQLGDDDADADDEFAVSDRRRGGSRAVVCFDDATTTRAASEDIGV